MGAADVCRAGAVSTRCSGALTALATVRAIVQRNLPQENKEDKMSEKQERIAVAGATSLLGRELAEELQNGPFAAANVVLMDEGRDHARSLVDKMFVVFRQLDVA